MTKTISDLEKAFYIQRDRILKELNKEEYGLRKELSHFLNQMKILKKKQKQLQLLDVNAKKKLKTMQQRLNKMKKQEKEDEYSMQYMKKRIEQFKREIPIIEKNIKVIIPERNKIAKVEKALIEKLKPLNRKIAEKQAMIRTLRLKVKKLDKKEAFIKRGMIIWGEFKPKRKKRPAKKNQIKKIIEERQKKSFFSIFSFKTKQ